MGNDLNKMSAKTGSAAKPFVPNAGNYHSLDQAFTKMHVSGFEACELIVGIDFTRSRSRKATTTAEEMPLRNVYGDDNLHVQALSCISRRLKMYDDDCLIPCYGFGDAATGSSAVFSLFDKNESARGLSALVDRYKTVAPSVTEFGPKSFAPLIRQAMKDVYNSGMKFHVLLILSDGQISPECLQETQKAIVDACAFPLSIVMIGIGEGPWSEMEYFDKELPGRDWDNFHFFDFSEVSNKSLTSTPEELEEDFELNVISEIPEQFVYVRNLCGEHNKSRVRSLIEDVPSDILIDTSPCRR